MIPFGFNIHSAGVKDRQRIIDWHRTAQPAWTLVLDDTSLVRDIKNVSPKTEVIYRAYPGGGDESIWQRLSPEQWVAEARRKSEGLGCWVYCLNEPGFGDDVLNWLCKVIDIAMPAGLKLVIGNFSVGTPEPGAWGSPAAVNLLSRLNKHRANLVLGLHEYAVGVITSGFVGGAPTELYIEGHLAHRDFISPANWPGRNEALNTTMWHVGRVKFLLNACRKMGINPPRVVMTECGFDSLTSDPSTDLRRWIASLPTNEGEIRGWRSLRPYWAKVYPQWSHEQAYFEALKYAWNTIYAGTTVEGMVVYCYGHADAQWASFDVEGAGALLNLLGDFSNTPAPPVSPPPQPPPPPFPPAPTPPQEAVYNVPIVVQVKAPSETRAREIVHSMGMAMSLLFTIGISNPQLAFPGDITGS